jgi:hypothetical protein
VGVWFEIFQYSVVVSKQGNWIPSGTVSHPKRIDTTLVAILQILNIIE